MIWYQFFTDARSSTCEDLIPILLIFEISVHLRKIVLVLHTLKIWNLSKHFTPKKSSKLTNVNFTFAKSGVLVPILHMVFLRCVQQGSLTYAICRTFNILGYGDFCWYVFLSPLSWSIFFLLVLGGGGISKVKVILDGVMLKFKYVHCYVWHIFGWAYASLCN